MVVQWTGIPPASAGVMGSILGPGRAHTPCGNRGPQLLKDHTSSSPCSTTSKATSVRSPRTATGVATTARDSPHAATKTQCSQN